MDWVGRDIFKRDSLVSLFIKEYTEKGNFYRTIKVKTTIDKCKNYRTKSVKTTFIDKGKNYRYRNTRGSKPYNAFRYKVAK